MDASHLKSSARRYWPLLKRVFLLLVLLFVARRAVQLWANAPMAQMHVNGWWLIPAALIYFVGWMPSVWFWKAMLQRLQQRVQWSDIIRAYYVGNVGKYVPGKALVIVIRASILADAGVNSVLGGVTVVCETLVFMAAGAALALAVSPIAFGDAVWLRLPSQLSWFRGQPLLTFLIVVMGTFATTPISAWLFTKASRGAGGHSSTELPQVITARLVSLGVAVTSLGWVCHAMSLGFVLKSVSIQPFEITEFPIWLGACTASVVGGFVVLFAPGGVGVREGLLIEVLKDQPGIGPATTIVVAGLLRLVWFATELVAAVVFFLLRKRQTASADTSK